MLCELLRATSGQPSTRGCLLVTDDQWIALFTKRFAQGGPLIAQSQLHPVVVGQSRQLHPCTGTLRCTIPRRPGPDQGPRLFLHNSRERSSRIMAGQKKHVTGAVSKGLLRNTGDSRGAEILTFVCGPRFRVMGARYMFTKYGCTYILYILCVIVCVCNSV